EAGRRAARRADEGGVQRQRAADFQTVARRDEVGARISRSRNVAAMPRRHILPAVATFAGGLMRIADVLHHTNRIVHKIRTIDTVAKAVRKLSEHNIGALVVTDRWGRHAG